jgi:hypothetical protein
MAGNYGPVFHGKSAVVDNDDLTMAYLFIERFECNQIHDDVSVTKHAENYQS